MVSDGGSQHTLQRKWHREHQRRLEQRGFENVLNIAPSNTANGTVTASNNLIAQCHLYGLLPHKPAWLGLPIFDYENSLAIRLAIKHLNEGNGGLVEDLRGLNETCPITFSASMEKTNWDPRYAFQVVDKLTEESTSTALATTAQPKRPCAFVGGISSAVSKTTAMVTGLRGYPQVSQASTDQKLNDKDEYPLFARTIPDDSSMAEALVRFFYEELGVRHLFLIVELEPFPKSVLQSLRDAVLKLGLSPVTSTNTGNDNNLDPNALYVEERVIRRIYDDEDPDLKNITMGVAYEAIEALKESDVRFVLALTHHLTSLEKFMELAYERGVAGTGSHHWWFYEVINLANNKATPGSAEAKAFNGVGYITQASEREGIAYQQFVKDSLELKKELYQSYPDEATAMTSDDWLFAPKNEFPYLGENDWLVDGYAMEKPLYAYDATVLLGLSACREIAAQRANHSETFDNSYKSLMLKGPDFYERIRHTNFTGVTGHVLLDPETGTRSGNSVKYTIGNWVAFDEIDEDGNLTVRFRGTTSYEFTPGDSTEWSNVSPHILSNGRSIASLGSNPDLPPLEEDYLLANPWITRAAIGLMVLILLKTAGFVIWTFKFWKSRLVQASQPHFLLLICLGIVTMALAIVPISMEHIEGRINDENIDAPIQYDRICTSTFWFAIVGFGITYSTLFAKTYRINRIIDHSIKCKRIQISIQETLYPVAIMFCFNVIMLSLMTVFGPIGYEITITQLDKFDRPTERYGNCSYGRALPFLIPIGAVNFGMVSLALFQAWRARNLSTEFAESQYIANALLITFLVTLFSIPVLILTQENPNPNLDTFINTTLAWVFSGNTICFIFVPKILFHLHLKSQTSRRSSRRSSRIVSSLLGQATEGIDISGRSRSSVERIPSNDGAMMARDSVQDPRHVGEKILTSKPQHQLVSEMKSIKRKNGALQAEIAELQKCLLQLTSDGVNHDTIANDATLEFKSSSLSDDDDSEVGYNSSVDLTADNLKPDQYESKEDSNTA